MTKFIDTFSKTVQVDIPELINFVLLKVSGFVEGTTTSDDGETTSTTDDETLTKETDDLDDEETQKSTFSSRSFSYSNVTVSIILDGAEIGSHAVKDLFEIEKSILISPGTHFFSVNIFSTTKIAGSVEAILYYEFPPPPTGLKDYDLGLPETEYSPPPTAEEPVKKEVEYPPEYFEEYIPPKPRDFDYPIKFLKSIDLPYESPVVDDSATKERTWVDDWLDFLSGKFYLHPVTLQ